VRIARDREFLFLHCRCERRSSTDGTSSKNSRKPESGARQRDSLNDAVDHVRLRIDLDRDYATWFEFAWDCEGETLEQCNDLPWWNPEWFVAFHSDAAAWSAEIAIPLASLIPAADAGPSDSDPPSPDGTRVAVSGGVEPSRALGGIDWLGQAWGLSIVREHPSEYLECLVPNQSDIWTADQWRLITFDPAPASAEIADRKPDPAPPSLERR
jgi:hypothetical protein